ncbi:MAG: autotransporter domain-containing protein [Parvibaculum sp.]|uniref:autotransporter outer membrane beta-barrel domain-containing protein n=1 Tax=Parvibaculum sp. TaxID=2024848 RepID=UPI0025D875BA|nr:autotransporter domain-containing protein [Parvibaculum sp.]MCE9649823.1 autotransporter domain-containing protein [Parvibaculum sp.]
MTVKLSLRAKLLGTSALAAAGSFMLGMGPALAIPAAPSCTGLPPVNGGKVVCSGTSYYSLQSGANDLTVTLNPSANLIFGYDPTVALYGDNAKLLLKNGASIQGYNSYVTVIAAGDGFDITLNGGSHITLEGNNNGSGKYIAVGLAGSGGSLTLNGASSVDVSGGSTSSGAKYSAVTGFASTITLNGGSSINVDGTGAGDNKYTGIFVIDAATSAADISSLTLNNGSSVNIHGSSLAQNAGFYGILAATSGGSYGPNVTLNGGSSVNLVGSGGSNNKYWGLISAGSTVTLNSGSSINVTGGGGGDNKYLGLIALDNGSGTTSVTLNSSSINIHGNGGGSKYVGVMSFGSGPGKYIADLVMNGSSINIEGDNGDIAVGVASYGDGGHVTLNDASINLNTENISSGYNGGIQVRGNSNIVTLNGSSQIEVGRDGNKYGIGIGVSGSYNAVALNGSSAVVVHAYGIGSAGIGLADGPGNTLTLNGNAHVTTYGAPAVYVADTSGTSVALNGNSEISSFYGVGILATDSDTLSIALNGTSTVYGSYMAIALDNVSDSSISIGRGTTVSGNTGIYVNGNHNDIYVAGSVTGYGGDAINLSNAVNSTLTLGTGAAIFGDILGGSGSDFLTLQGHGELGSAISNFDRLTVNADGIWNLNTDLDLDGGPVTINSGTLAVNGDLYAGTVTVESGGTLGGSGTVFGDINNYGTISPGNSPGTLFVVGSTTFNAGSTFLVQTDGVTSDMLAVSGAPGTVTINGGTVVPQFIGGVDGFAGDILTATGGITGTFDGASGGVLDYSVPNVISLTAVSPSSVNGGLSGGAGTGFTFLDTVLGQAHGPIGRGKGLWGVGLWQSADRSSNGTTRGFDQHSQGGAIGGDVLQSGGFTLGLAGGYVDSTVTTAGGGTRTSIDGYNAALYGSFDMSGTYLVMAVNGAWQKQDVTRNVLSGGSVVAAKGSPDGWLGGAGLAVGHAIPIQDAWTITPRASLSWQHMERDGYTETGGGLGGVSMGDVGSDTVRGLVGAELGLTVKDPNALWSVRPAIRAGLAQEWRSGDETVNGTFNTGGAFTAALDTRDQTYLALGAGVDITIGNGVSAFAYYDGGVGGDVEKNGGVRIGARLEW